MLGRDQRKNDHRILQSIKVPGSLNVKYGLFTYTTDNVGDDVQSLAARAFLPSIDLYVDRDALSELSEKNDPVKIIMNGWYMHKPYDWPPPDNVRPLFVAFHLSKNAVKHVLSVDGVRYLKKHQPIGCRDHSTVAHLKSHGIEAYFSGCLTTTTHKRESEQHNKIVLCDPFGHDEKFHWFVKGDKTYENYLKRYLKLDPRDCEYVTHEIDASMPTEDRYAEAERLLRIYSGAKLVITSRIHCALPCAGMGIPVIFLAPRRLYEMKYFGMFALARKVLGIGKRTDSRFAGISELFESYDFDEILAGRQNIDLSADRVPPTSDGLSQMQNRLRNACVEFVKA